MSHYRIARIIVFCGFTVCYSQQPQSCTLDNFSCGCMIDASNTTPSVPTQYNGANHNLGCQNPQTGQDGIQYLCPEYVRRFYRLAKHVDTSSYTWYSANGVDFFPRANALGLIGYPNCIAGTAPGQPLSGCTANTLPQADDIVSFCRLILAKGTCDLSYPGHVGDPGHVAIIKGVAQTGDVVTITLLEQNWSKHPNQVLTASQNSDGTYTVFDRQGANQAYFRVQGWLRLPTTNTPAPSTITEYPVEQCCSNGGWITLGPDDGLWFTLPDLGIIARIATTGVISDEYFLPLQLGNGFLPAVVIGGPDGALWFNSFGTPAVIGRITIDGEASQYSLQGASSSYAQGIAVGPDGALWFTQCFYNRIGRITTAGAITWYPVPTPNSCPLGITPGPDGALWFVEATFVGGIGRITVSGSITEYPLTGYDHYPSYITVGSDGALWFREEGNGGIGRITTSGSVTEYSGANTFTGGYAQGIVAGPDGALWFTECVTNSIGRITTAGAVSWYIVPSPNSCPSGIAVGPDASIWFTEGGKVGRLVIFP